MMGNLDGVPKEKPADFKRVWRRERLSNLWFLRISQNTQIAVYQSSVKLAKN